MQGRYYLMPIEQLARVNTATALQNDSNMNQVDNYATKIRSILNDKSLPSDVSNQLLNQANNRYDAFKEAELNVPLKIAINDPEPRAETGERKKRDTQKQNIDMTTVLKQVTGKKAKNDARHLLSSIIANPDIKVNENGEIILQNNLLPGSNISLAVADLVRHVRGPAAAGATELGNFLVNEVGIPSKLIANPNRRRLFEDDAVQSPFLTPGKSSRRTPQKQTSRRKTPEVYKSIYKS